MTAWSKLSGTAQGIVLMIVTMFLFSVLDAMAKEVAHRTDTVMAIWARYAGQTVAVTLLIAPRIRSVLKTGYPRLQLLRSRLSAPAAASFHIVADCNHVLLLRLRSDRIGERSSDHVAKSSSYHAWRGAYFG